jgi:hypothetical protein
MSDPESPLPPNGPSASESDAEVDSLDGQKMANLLKHALSETVPREPSALLIGVQRKLRQRSRGKFYGDGWSTSDTRVSYILVAVVMLVILGVAYFVLGPVDIVAPK